MKSCKIALAQINPILGNLAYNKNKILNSKILNKLNLKSNNFFLVSLHREENIDNNTNLQKIIKKFSQG